MGSPVGLRLISDWIVIDVAPIQSAEAAPLAVEVTVIQLDSNRNSAWFDWRFIDGDPDKFIYPPKTQTEHDEHLDGVTYVSHDNKSHVLYFKSCYRQRPRRPPALVRAATRSPPSNPVILPVRAGLFLVFRMKSLSKILMKIKDFRRILPFKNCLVSFPVRCSARSRATSAAAEGGEQHPGEVWP